MLENTLKHTLISTIHETAARKYSYITIIKDYTD